MSTVVHAPTRDAAERVTRIELVPHGLEAFLEPVRRLPGRLRYSDGSLTLVSPSMPHEQNHELIHDIVETICDEFEIDYAPLGSTLFVRDDVDKGVEPDQSFYLEHRPALAGARDVKRIDLRRFPPPDLVVEAVWTHPVEESLVIYRALGVPEVWVHEIPEEEIRFLLLEPDGDYASSATSRAFPFLTPEDVLAQVRAGATFERPHYQWKRQLRHWVRETLGPRRVG